MAGSPNVSPKTPVLANDGNMNEFLPVDEDVSIEENLRRINHNLRQNRVFLKYILRNMPQISQCQTGSPSRIEDVQTALRRIVCDHVRDSLYDDESCHALFTTKQSNIRDVLWDRKCDAHLKQDAADAQSRAYILKYLHNRISRLLPGLVIFYRNAGSKYV